MIVTKLRFVDTMFLTSTEAESNISFLLSMLLSGEAPEEKTGLLLSTVCCLLTVSRVSLSPMLAWRNQGNEIFRRNEPEDLGGLEGAGGGLVTDMLNSLC